MKLLYLLRHAKSSWDEPELADHERPLSPRGERAAARVAGHLREEGISPALVLCSSSQRTRQTLAALLPAFEGDVELRIERGLYGAGPDTLLARLHTIPVGTPSTLVICHSPGIEELALLLARGGERLDGLREHFPTGGLATLAIPHAGWSELGRGDAELAGYIVPREL